MQKKQKKVAGSKVAAKVDLRKLPKEKRPEPTTGQSGPKLELAAGDLSKKEAKVVRALAEVDTTEAQSIKAIAKGGRLTMLQVRNGLRRLVRARWVANVERGKYRLTAVGITNAAMVEAVPAKPKAAPKKASKGEHAPMVSPASAEQSAHA